ncbi:MAG TPA: SPFH domain-containing protein [Aggregatilinea sp.]|jgi:membrane protease subunit (stomatin/prohibitin family)|uniref:SPFH domain-containing protein n=1 Tax=Aggregatilinea sp. TaxID=2806333 RepID=UPI002C238C93|nr:SPFH domain-containing protein [Aggregatilinea sp.]HML20208.1 SPFH domain-containing protein [Aggregatilinea sp.]
MPRIIDVVDHTNVMDDELVYREPQGGSGDFRMGSQVIVQESQVAIFVRQGQVLDALGPGSHTLSTGNLPILSGLIGLATSGRTPFTADLYFVNLKDLPQVPWGTNPPIVLETPGKGVGVVLLITHGVIDIGVDDPMRFMKQYAVGKPILRLGDIRDRIQSMLLGELAGLLSTSGAQSIMDANRLLGDLEGAALARLNEQFAQIGMRIKAFEAKPFTAKDVPTDELRNYVDIDTWERIKRLDVANAAAGNPGAGGSLAGAGVGLGVGQSLGAAMNPEQAALQQQQQMMMNQMMMQMMQNNQQGGQQAPQQAAAPAVPQTAAEIRAYLDQLDMKLASGELSESMYDKLSQKWEARLKELGG